jgi:hypothetical protein
MTAVPVSGGARTGIARCDYRIKLPKDPTFEGWRCTGLLGHSGDHGYSIVAEEEWEAAAAAPLVQTPSGDDCRECGRQLNVEEPAYRAPGGDGWRCAQCELADVHTPTGERRLARRVHVDGSGRFLRAETFEAYEAPTLTPLGRIADMATSTLMEVAGAALFDSAIPGTARSVAAQLRAELRKRAGALASEAARYEDGDDEGARGDVLRAIGQVRS